MMKLHAPNFGRRRMYLGFSMLTLLALSSLQVRGDENPMFGTMSDEELDALLDAEEANLNSRNDAPDPRIQVVTPANDTVGVWLSPDSFCKVDFSILFEGLTLGDEVMAEVSIGGVFWGMIEKEGVTSLSCELPFAAGIHEVTFTVLAREGGTTLGFQRSIFHAEWRAVAADKVTSSVGELRVVLPYCNKEHFYVEGDTSPMVVPIRMYYSHWNDSSVDPCLSGDAQTIAMCQPQLARRLTRDTAKNLPYFNIETWFNGNSVRTDQSAFRDSGFMPQIEVNGVRPERYLTEILISDVLGKPLAYAECRYSVRMVNRSHSWGEHRSSNFGVADEAWAINLDHREQRLASVRQSVAKLGIAVERWPAVDASAMSDDGLNALLVSESSRWLANQFIRRGVIGCCASHRAILHRVVERRLSRVLILEDDAAVNSLATEEILKERLNAVPPDADIVYLGYRSPVLRNQIRPGVYRGAGWCNHAYMVTWQGAERMLKLVEPMPAAHDLVWAWACMYGWLRCYMLDAPRDPKFPEDYGLFVQDQERFSSDINDDVIAKWGTGSAQIMEVANQTNQTTAPAAESESVAEETTSTEPEVASMGWPQFPFYSSIGADGVRHYIHYIGQLHCDEWNPPPHDIRDELVDIGDTDKSGLHDRDQFFFSNQNCGNGMGGASGGNRIPIGIRGNADSDVAHGLVDGVAPLRVTFVSDLTYFRIEFATGGPVVGWMYEPPRVCPWCIDFVKQHLPHFDMFISHNPPLLELDRLRMRFCPIAQSYVPHALRKVYPKTKGISIVASAKVRLQGHRLRHKVIARFRHLFDGVFGRGETYSFLPSKLLAAKDFRFAIIIENSRSVNYFPEIIMDCIFSGAVPVYWGAPNIGSFFDMEGIITWEKIDDLEAILPTLTPERYESMLPAVHRNLARAWEYSDHLRCTWNHVGPWLSNISRTDTFPERAANAIGSMIAQPAVDIESDLETSPIRFKIVIPSCQRGAWAKRTILSLLNQSYTNWTAVAVHACDHGTTLEALRSVANKDSRITIVESLHGVIDSDIRADGDDEQFEMESTVRGIQYDDDKHPDDVIVIIRDGDWLYDGNVLATVARTYIMENSWMTMGLCIEFPTAKIVPPSLDFPEFSTRSWGYRQLAWPRTHMRTFRRWLFDTVDDRDLRFDNGTYFSGFPDMGYMLPMLESARGHVTRFGKVLYTQNVVAQYPVSEPDWSYYRRREVASVIRNRQRYHTLNSDFENLSTGISVRATSAGPRVRLNLPIRGDIFDDYILIEVMVFNFDVGSMGEVHLFINDRDFGVIPPNAMVSVPSAEYHGTEVAVAAVLFDLEGLPVEGDMAEDSTMVIVQPS